MKPVKVRGIGQLGGHKPIGDMATLMIGFDKVSGKRILHIFHDTSYSPVEGNNQIEVYADGSVRIYGRNRFGTEIALEYPNEEIMREWGAIKKRYDDQKISEYDVPEPDKTKADRYERYSRLGMVAGGRLIIGFERTRDKDGKLVTNYDNYVTVSQKGRDFTYQNIDVYGLRLFEKANGPLKYAESDLEGMLKKAELEKIAALKSLGKEVLTKTDMTEFLAGKDVVLLSGPADESLGPILNPGGNKDYVKSEVVLAFKRYLKAIPLNDNSRVFLSGGTTGLEPLLTNLVLKENESRLRYGGTELPVIGNITSVTGKGEIDPRIQKYYVIPETFYWIDYLENLMKDTLLPSKLKSLKFLLAGGGGILPLQIKQAIEAARNDSRLSVSLLDGVTMHPEDPTFRKRSGTDKTIDAMRKSGDIPASVSIMTAKDGRFVTTHGQASSFDLKSNVRKAQDRSTRESRGQSQRPAINACEALFSI